MSRLATREVPATTVFRLLFDLLMEFERGEGTLLEECQCKTMLFIVPRCYPTEVKRLMVEWMSTHSADSEQRSLSDWPLRCIQASLGCSQEGGSHKQLDTNNNAKEAGHQHGKEMSRLWMRTFRSLSPRVWRVLMQRVNYSCQQVLSRVARLHQHNSQEDALLHERRDSGDDRD